MRNTTGKPLLKSLLYSTSAFALSVGAANATTMLSEHTADPFLFGDKQVVFDLTDCFDCGDHGLSALPPDNDGNIGFRLSFTGIPLFVSSGVRTSGDLLNVFVVTQAGIDFTVTAGPMFKIIGAALAADAGATASYDYMANGQDSSGFGSADAHGGVDLALSEATNSFAIDLDTVWDVNVGATGLNDSDSSDSASSGSTEMVMDALDAAITYTFSLDWRIESFAECDLSDFDGIPVCSADASAFINTIDVRFKQMEMAVPEPGTWTLFGIGLAGLAALQRRRRRPS